MAKAEDPLEPIRLMARQARRSIQTRQLNREHVPVGEILGLMKLDAEIENAEFIAAANARTARGGSSHGAAPKARRTAQARG